MAVARARAADAPPTENAGAGGEKHHDRGRRELAGSADALKRADAPGRQSLCSRGPPTTGGHRAVAVP